MLQRRFYLMKYLSRPLLIGFALITLLATSCGSCGSCGSDESEDLSKSPDAGAVEAEEPDTAGEAAAKLLEEAQKDAKKHGSKVGFDRTTAARFFASELEGLNKKNIGAPAVKRAAKATDLGTIDPAGVRRVFNSRHGELQACYERGLKGDPQLQGKVTLTIRIGKDGAPTMTRARSGQLNSRAVLNCMEQTSKKWLFPHPKGGTVLVNKPYTFEPKI